MDDFKVFWYKFFVPLSLRMVESEDDDRPPFFVKGSEREFFMAFSPTDGKNGNAQVGKKPVEGNTERRTTW
jgi:hypothetical protein